jgi:hypothetical protein
MFAFAAAYGLADCVYFGGMRERWQNFKSLFTVMNPFTIMAWLVIGLVIAMIIFCVCDYYFCHSMGWI